MEFGMLPDKVYQLSLFKIYTRRLALLGNKYGAWIFLPDGVGVEMNFFWWWVSPSTTSTLRNTVYVIAIGRWFFL